MSRTSAFKIAGASNTTRWTLESPLGSVDESAMQANGNYFAHQRTDSPSQVHPPSNGYHRYNTSVSSARTASAQGYRQNGSHDDYAGYHSPLDERASYQISVNTQLKRRNTDVVGQHMLYETAMMDSQNFEILDIGEVDALKKEHVRLNQKIEGAQRKLVLESKLKDAAQNLQRLYSSGKKRPDTPQDKSPDSPKRSRGSLLGRSNRSDSGGIEHLSQASNELAAAVKKVDDVQDQVKQLLDRRQYVERKLLRHTAAVLA